MAGGCACGTGRETFLDSDSDPRMSQPLVPRHQQGRITLEETASTTSQLAGVTAYSCARNAKTHTNSVREDSRGKTHAAVKQEEHRGACPGINSGGDDGYFLWLILTRRTCYVLGDSLANNTGSNPRCTPPARNHNSVEYFTQFNSGGLKFQALKPCLYSWLRVWARRAVGPGSFFTYSRSKGPARQQAGQG